jgi:hypothetical protein
MIQGKTYIFVLRGGPGRAAKHMVGAPAVTAEEAAGETSAVGHVAGATSRCAAQIRRAVVDVAVEVDGVA